MPYATVTNGRLTGMATGTNEARDVPLPALPHVAYDIKALSFSSSVGQQLTGNDALILALSHQTDEASGPASGLTDGSPDHWFTKSVQGADLGFFLLMPAPFVRVAGPQRLLLANDLGNTTFYRMVVYYETVAIRGLNQWSALKARTSFEGIQ